MSGFAVGAALTPELMAQMLLKLAEANGVNGTLAGAAPEDAGEAPAEPPVDPRMEAAYDAIEAGDWAAARAAYQSILDSAPADPVGRAGLALVGLFERGPADHAEDVRLGLLDVEGVGEAESEGAKDIERHELEDVAVGRQARGELRAQAAA